MVIDGGYKVDCYFINSITNGGFDSDDSDYYYLSIDDLPNVLTKLSIYFTK
jgi:hypothetical protein